MNIIEVKNVSKRYKENMTLENIDLFIRKGEIFGLLGPSGVGKTTLIKLITAQTQPDSGRISVFGCDTSKWNSKQNLKIGIMMDNVGAFERMSCFENMMLYCKILNIPISYGTEYLEKVGLSDSVNKKVSELSKGMKQRLLFARALLNSPELLILDEPTSDLDPKTSLLMHEIIQNLHKQGTTIIMTTHNMQEALEICDYIGILYEGKLVEYGKPKEICEKYNLTTQITIIDKLGNTFVYNNNKDSAEEICRHIKNENIKEIFTTKSDFKEIFLRLTGGDTVKESRGQPKNSAL